MSDYSPHVNQQYGRVNLTDKIINALKDAGKDINHLTREDLTTFDEFHIGGVSETRKLANKIPNLTPASKVLDIGSGLGGPARTLAVEYDCDVVGLDLTVEYCNVAIKLTDLVGLSEQITFQHGNALDMPFDDDSFDIVWTQFAGMNIDDKQQLYKQCYRVLRHNGYLAFHEVMAGNTPDLIYPVFWADADDVNFLKSADYVRQILEAVGFHEIVWDDLTQYSIEWFENMLVQRTTQAQQPALGFNIFVGNNTPQKAANVIQNIREGRVGVMQAVYQARKQG